MWKACHVGGPEQCALDAEARTLLGVGLCQILSCLDDEARLKGSEDLLSFPQNELEKQAQLADEARDEETRKNYLLRLSGEIRLIGALCRSLTNTGATYSGSMESGCPSSPDRRELVPPPVMNIVRRSWPKIAQLASTYSYDEVSRHSSFSHFHVRVVNNSHTPLRTFPALFVRFLWISCRHRLGMITVFPY